MYRKYLLYIVFAVAVTVLNGCGAEVHLRKAEQSYALGEYYQAAALYKKAYSGTPAKEKPLRAERAYMMADCYRRINYIPRAMAAYQNAIRYKYPDTLAYRYLADMQLRNGEYKNAAKNYNIYLEAFPDDELALNGLQSATQSLEWKQNPTRYIVKKDALFNSKYSDFSPAYGNDSYTSLYFTSSRDESTGDDINGITGMKSCDIYFSEKDEKGKWKKPVKIEGGPNSEFEDGSIAFSPDFGTMYFTYCPVDAQFARPAQIMKSGRSDAAWGAATPYIAESNDTLNSYAHPAISPDGEWIYFVSDMPGGYGGLDLWRVEMGGRFIGAENLGPDINTSGNEMFPTFRKNGEFYFSSDGHPGMGGLDIFKAVQLTDSTWTIENMKSPVNSFADDFGMTFEGDYTRGFFTSNRNDGRGRDNIYSFELPETVHKITGWVYEKDGYELTDAIVYLVGDDGTNTKLGVRDDGSFTQRVNPGTNYLLLGTSKGYLNYKQEISTDSTNQDKEYVLQFPLSSISKPVLIDNIFFDFDKATLRPESAESLNELATLLTDNPHVTIEIGAHCDYKGDDDYNLRLSAARAQSVVDYLITAGIAADRLTAKGYGEEKPVVVSKKQAEQYPFLVENQLLYELGILLMTQEQQDICNQLNRRIEFRVLRTTYGMFR
ncbi:MAG: OmpA family protein [Bacteroidaceae bacterium]|nr:OmpA family protein [Bacteroidaceae bacterium]